MSSFRLILLLLIGSWSTYGCGTLPAESCPGHALAEEKLWEASVRALEPKGFKLDRATDQMFVRRLDCNYRVRIEYAPNRPGGWVLVVLDPFGEPIDVQYGR